MKHVGAHVVDSDLHAFADNMLPAERRTAVLTALEADAAEARRVSDWCAQNEAIRRLLGKVLHEPVPVTLSLTALPPGSEPSGSARILDPGHPTDPRPRRGFRGVRKARTMAGLIGLCVVVFVSGWAGARLVDLRSGETRNVEIGDVSDTTTAFALRAIETYRTFAPDTQYPVEIPAAQTPRLVQWLERRLGEPVTVPRLAGTGFALLGGRLVPWAAKRPAALLIYQHASGPRLALMFAKVALGAEQPFRHETFKGVGAITWMQSGNVVSVVGSTEPQRLRSVATVVASELNEAAGP